MRTVFEILPSELEEEKCSLFCEVSDEGFAFCIREEETNSFLGVAIYHYDKSKPSVGFPIDLQIIFHQKEILSKKFKKVCVVFSHSESVLVPFSIYKREKSGTVLNMMCGDLNSNEMIFTDVISNQSMYNCYRVRQATYEVIQNQFSSLESMHQYSLLLKNPADQDNQLAVIFNSNKIIVRLIKDNKYQLIHSYDYETPEDVSYILLNICRQFDIREIQLQLNGLIEEKSSLYNEIFKYFNKIEFAPLPEGSNFSEEILKYPPHYFSYIFQMSQCE
jgi:hypothetical protein